MDFAEDSFTVRDALEEAFFGADEGETFVLLTVDNLEVGWADSYEAALEEFEGYLDNEVFTFDDVESEDGRQGFEVTVFA
jgi:hypothetical protein